MTAKEISLAFIKRFCESDVQGLAPLLAEKLEFHGPFLQCDSRDEYLSHLSVDQLAQCEFKIHDIIEEGREVCVLYEYLKRDSSILIAQFFTIENGLISRLRLVFDTKRISEE